MLRGFLYFVSGHPEKYNSHFFFFKQDLAGTEPNLKGDLLVALQELTTLVRQEHAKVALRARQVRAIIYLCSRNVTTHIRSRQCS